MNQEERIQGLQRELLKAKGGLIAANILLRLILKQYKPELWDDINRPEVRRDLRKVAAFSALTSHDTQDAKLKMAEGFDEFLDLMTIDYPPR